MILNYRLLIGEVGVEEGGMEGESAPSQDRLRTYLMARHIIADFK
jgi:hypothetical protein